MTLYLRVCESTNSGEPSFRWIG